MSADFNLFSLLGPSLSSNSVLVSCLGRAEILFLSSVLYFHISCRTAYISTSGCRIVLGTYHGAFTIALSTLFWNFCIISIVVDNRPQGGIPYIHIGFKMILYNKSLLFVDNAEFLPIWLNFWPSFFPFVSSPCQSPKHLISYLCGTGYPFNVIPRFSACVIWTYLASFSSILHRRSHSWRWLGYICRFMEAMMRSSWCDSIYLSSAYVAIIVWAVCAKSAVYSYLENRGWTENPSMWNIW